MVVTDSDKSKQYAFVMVADEYRDVKFIMYRVQ